MSGLQRGMIEFEVDQTQLQRIELKLKDMKAKATPATATAGLAGESKNGETPENVVGRVPKTPTRSKGAKKNG